MVNRKYEHGPPMVLGNMRGLAVYCLNNACQHRALSDVSYYSG